MTALDDIAQERQRLAERLAKIDADRAKLAEQLSELEAAERVLSRFTEAKPARRRGRGAAATPTPAAAPRSGRRGRRVAIKPTALSLGDATLRAIETRGNGGISAEDIQSYLASELGMQVRPNHLGMALQRHRRAGRLEQRDALWFSQSDGEEAAA
jgi:sirohydrochlorin ferrochelatase